MTGRVRQRGHEIAFGSDSFLDVLTNIVGILIIFIVIVGIRVANAPPRPPGEPAEQTNAELSRRAQWQQERDRINGENARRRDEYQAAARRRDEQLAQRRADHGRRQRGAQRARAERLEAIQERSTLVGQYERETRQLEQQVTELTAELARETHRTKAAQRERQHRQADQDAKHARLEQLRAAVQTEADAIKEHELQSERTNEKLAELREQLPGLRRDRRPAQTWAHYLTPIAERVRRRELHFRCRAGRVADTHLDDLIELVRQKALTSTSRVATMTEASVGPIGGFRLRYMLGRSGSSFSQQLSDPVSAGYVLAAWELQADSDELGESGERALAEGSKVRRALQDHAPGQFAITLWVYPDSFALAKSVTEDLHGRGYIVSQRPLPFDVQIAGSPFGTASQGQ